MSLAQMETFTDSAQVEEGGASLRMPGQAARPGGLDRIRPHRLLCFRRDIRAVDRAVRADGLPDGAR